jgi:hypothetical protein
VQEEEKPSVGIFAKAKEIGVATPDLAKCLSARNSIGPLGVGLVLDWAGNAHSWGLAFGHLALITLMGLFLLRLGARSAVQTVDAASG